jgi:hypothetical protein
MCPLAVDGEAASRSNDAYNAHHRRPPTASASLRTDLGRKLRPLFQARARSIALESLANATDKTSGCELVHTSFILDLHNARHSMSGRWKCRTAKMRRGATSASAAVLSGEHKISRCINGPTRVMYSVASQFPWVFATCAVSGRGTRAQIPQLRTQFVADTISYRKGPAVRAPPSIDPL